LSEKKQTSPTGRGQISNLFAIRGKEQI
jgi:hypothetical protein